MTDKKFQDLIDDTLRCLKAYKLALGQAEIEYERRYGTNPNEVDDSFWIDSMHYNPMPFTVEEHNRNR